MVMTLEQLHKKSFKNSEQIKTAEICSCFYCLRKYPGKTVKEFAKEDDNKATAICPFCWIDAVIPEDVSEQVLKEMCKTYFEINREILEKMEIRIVGESY